MRSRPLTQIEISETLAKREITTALHRRIRELPLAPDDHPATIEPSPERRGGGGDA